MGCLLQLATKNSLSPSIGRTYVGVELVFGETVVEVVVALV